MSHHDEIRLMVKIARMYYDQGIRQQEITQRLNIHQSTISRLLKRARETNVVRISVSTPTGIYSELEEALENRYSLKEAIVVDSQDDDDHMVRDLGAATAFFVETTVKKGMVIGISSWSQALLAMVDLMNRTDRGSGGKVVQILGGIGNANPQLNATHLAQRLASSIGAESILLQAPAVAGSSEARNVFSADPAVRAASIYFGKIDLALVGIGCLEPSRLLASSGNVFSPSERHELGAEGAVGDICLRFIDQNGKAVRSSLMNRVVGIDLAHLKKTSRVVGVAGGLRKEAAIRAAMLGGWINVLVTDHGTAQRLLRQPGSSAKPAQWAESRTRRKAKGET